MTRIPEQTIEEIREKTNIVDLIGEYIQLTKRGKNWVGLCPFHGEKTPSFSVSEEKQLFHCFGCGASGNAITFIMDLENRPFTDAVHELSKRIGIALDFIPQQGETGSNQQFKPMIEAHELAANFYRHILLNTVEGEEALAYLEKRGFDRTIIEQYGIGWALDDYQVLTSLLERKGYQLEEMEAAGLIVKRDDGTGYFDRFRGRVMFPLWDDNGNIIGFSGRLLEKLEHAPKYLNSPESPIFEKNKVLYNLHQARLNIRKTGKVILFEGFMDVISANKIGVQNTVALMGTALSESHLVKLKRIAKQLIICCDGDDAGWEAAKRFAQMAISENVDCQIALLPNGLDPDDYIQQFGEQSFKEQIIGKPYSYMSFMMAYAKRDKNLQYDNDVMQYVDEVMEELAKRPSPIERDLVIRQMEEETNVSEEALQQLLTKKVGRQVQEERKYATIPSSEASNEQMPIYTENRQRKQNATNRAEKMLLHYLLNDGELFDRIYVELFDLFYHEEYQTVFIELAAFYEQYKTPDYHRFAESIANPSLRKIVLEAAMYDSNEEFAAQEIEDCIHYLRKEKVKGQIDEKQHEQNEALRSNNHTRALELAREIIQLRQSLEAL
ncbi:MAG TPA: DNA primase [Sporosarcina sp.]|nr:DNA primase [Sporosarcina sp.]